MVSKKRKKSMMSCERCGKEMPDNMAICPACGTITSAMQGRPQPPTNHGPYPPDGPPVGYGQGYSPQPGYMQPPQQGYMQPPQPGYGYGQPYGNPSFPGQVNVNIFNNQQVGVGVVPSNTS